VNRILAVVFIAGAALLHVTYCQWEFPDSFRDIADTQYDRVIYASSAGHSPHRPRLGPENVFLMAKSGADLEEAKCFGVLLPAAMFGFATLVLYLERRADTPPRVV